MLFVNRVDQRRNSESLEKRSTRPHIRKRSLVGGRELRVETYGGSCTSNVQAPTSHEPGIQRIRLVYRPQGYSNEDSTDKDRKDQ